MSGTLFKFARIPPAAYGFKAGASERSLNSYTTAVIKVQHTLGALGQASSEAEVSGNERRMLLHPAAPEGLVALARAACRLLFDSNTRALLERTSPESMVPYAATVRITLALIASGLLHDMASPDVPRVLTALGQAGKQALAGTAACGQGMQHV